MLLYHDQATFTTRTCPRACERSGGHTGYGQHPHLHFRLYRDGFPFKILDPYSPLFEFTRHNDGYWTLDKDSPATRPWVLCESEETNPNILNYCPKKNSPQFPVTQQG